MLMGMNIYATQSLKSIHKFTLLISGALGHTAGETWWSHTWHWCVICLDTFTAVLEITSTPCEITKGNTFTGIYHPGNQLQG